MTVSLRFVVIVAVVAIGGFVAGFLLMGVSNELARGISLTGSSQADYGSQVTLGLVTGSLAALATGLLAWWLGANKGTPRVNVFIVLGVVVVLAFVPGVIRRVIQSRDEAHHNRIESDLIRGSGMAQFRVADRLTRSAGGPDALARIVRDPTASPEARLTAGLALIESQASPPDVNAAVDALVRAPGPLRLAAMDHFGELSTPVSYPGGLIGEWLEDALGDQDHAIQFAALKALAKPTWDREAHGHPCDTVAQLAGDTDPQVRAKALLMLGVCTPEAIAERLQSARQDPDPGVRRQAVHSILRLGDSPPARATRVAILVSTLRDGDATVREAAGQQLGWLRINSAIPEERAYRLTVLKELLTDSEVQLRLVAVEEIGTLAGRGLPPEELQTGVSMLMTAFRDSDPRVRQAAIEQLGTLRRELAAPAVAASGVRP